MTAPRDTCATRATRITTGGAYAEANGFFRPREVRITDGAAIDRDHKLRADVCVIGSGAGGAIVAKELAEEGLDVVVLEAGAYHTTDEFHARPHEALAGLYADAGQFTTIGNPPIPLPHCRAVGGTTLINSGTCFRTPEAVLNSWASDYGLRIDAAGLDPFFRRVERIVNVVQVSPEVAGRNAAIARRGAERLGWSGDYIFRNARGCVGSGVCAFGCPTSAKQHTGITYMAAAWNAGAETYTNTRAVRVLMRGGHATGVRAVTGGGATLNVEARLVIVACGTLATPRLLAASGLGGSSGELGRNLSIHPAGAAVALMDEEVRMWEGVPQSYFVDEFASEGVILEGIAGPPEYLASSLPLTGEQQREVMLQAERVAQFGLMVSDRSRGRVSSLAGRTVVSYSLCREDVTAVQRGLELLVRLFAAAGAREVVLPLAELPRVPATEAGAARVAAARPRATSLKLLGFHPLGTARAHAQPRGGVVDGDLRVHGVDGVYVADGSVVPTPLGVNPQITIMALATRLAYGLLDKSAPDEEPHPTAIATPKGKEPYLCHF